MPPEPTDSFDRLSAAELIETARGLLAEVLRLGAENERLRRELAELKTEHQAVKDELARLKKLPPRPPIKPSGMERRLARLSPREARSGRARSDGVAMGSTG